MTATTNQAASLCDMSAPFNRPDFQNNLFPQTFVFLWFQWWDPKGFHSECLWLPALWSHKKGRRSGKSQKQLNWNANSNLSFANSFKNWWQILKEALVRRSWGFSVVPFVHQIICYLFMNTQFFCSVSFHFYLCPICRVIIYHWTSCRASALVTGRFFLCVAIYLTCEI